MLFLEGKGNWGREGELPFEPDLTRQRSNRGSLDDRRFLPRLAPPPLSLFLSPSFREMISECFTRSLNRQESTRRPLIVPLSRFRFFLRARGVFPIQVFLFTLLADPNRAGSIFRSEGAQALLSFRARALSLDIYRNNNTFVAAVIIRATVPPPIFFVSARTLGPCRDSALISRSRAVRQSAKSRGHEHGRTTEEEIRRRGAPSRSLARASRQRL